MPEKFWAKTGNSKLVNGVPQYHPVICHLADTAAVAMEIMRTYLSPAAIDTLAKGLDLEGESLVKCCGFMAGSHDLGKISPAFQFQVSEVGKALAGESLYDLWSSLPREVRVQKTPHGTVTAATLPDFLIEIGLGQGLSAKLSKRLAKRLAAVVGGHHGFFPSAQEIEDLDQDLAGIDEQHGWRPFSRTIFQQLQSFVGLTSEDLPNQCGNAAAMILAGLTTVSDWIASNPDIKNGFPYANGIDFSEYVVDLPQKAQRALEAIGWRPVAKNEPRTFRELFPAIKHPRPLQEASIDLTEKLAASCLILVEASMGEGKTEAALYLADYLQHQTSVGGFYIGLPTQATSNAMWKRVEDFLGRRYPQTFVNLTLSHSAAALKADYVSCRLDQVYDEDKGVVASEWHTARKRSLLSPYGVGTIDQGLMGVVRSRHQFVRLFGLAGRTVILDEIHAYDLYTSTLLERFLEWLALLGSPVIALSATLPTETRQKLVNAYAKGCGVAEPELPKADYPRITAFTPAGLQVKSFGASEHVRRSLNICWVEDDDWAKKLRDQLTDTDGGCAAVICSTVARSQEVFGRLQDHFADEELGLFHGRFLFTDRERIEKDCLQKFGQKAGHRPHCYVLIATQVIEQSLDVDFDLMISDLAPIDLLLQRSGRLHRHTRDQRPINLRTPTLWVVAPSIDEQGKVQFAETGFIYDRHVLLRSWLTLRDRSNIQLPEETDRLIESVYDLEAAIPDNLETIHSNDWQVSLDEYHQDRAVQENTAKKVQVPPARAENKPEHFTRRGEEDDENSIAAMTRLGELSITTIFLRRTEAGLVLPTTGEAIDLTRSPNLETIRKLLEHSTRISKKGLVNALLAQENPKPWTSALLRNCRYIEVDVQNTAQVGKWRLVLDKQLGVVIESG
jgi:CRISPR-associated endonuclease/helicase Cas3